MGISWDVVGCPDHERFRVLVEGACRLGRLKVRIPVQRLDQAQVTASEFENIGETSLT